MHFPYGGGLRGGRRDDSISRESLQHALHRQVLLVGEPGEPGLRMAPMEKLSMVEAAGAVCPVDGPDLYTVSLDQLSYRPRCQAVHLRHPLMGPGRPTKQTTVI